MQRILNHNQLMNHGNLRARNFCLDILEHGLNAADPYRNTRQLIRLENNTLIFEGTDFEAAGDPSSGAARYPLTEDVRVFLFAVGKGIQSSAKAVEDVLGERLTGGYVIAKHGDPVIMERVEVMLGGHPVPDQCCIDGCKNMLQIITEARLTPSDLVITIIGNGVSSLMTLPSNNLPLEDIVRCVELLQIEHGVPTSELNHIRNNIDQLKGGRITRLLQPARMVHLLAVSPSVNNNDKKKGYKALIHNNFWLHTLPDQTSASHALDYLRARGINGQIPDSIMDALTGNAADSQGISPEEFQAADCRVFALMPECRDAASAALARAGELGLTPYLLTRKTQCEAGAVGRFIAQIALHAFEDHSPFHPPCALIFSGEMLVTCGADPGVGGRNQEFCLSAALALRGNSHIAVAAVDTDGTDGPGGFICDQAEEQGILGLAGAIVDGSTADAADKQQLNLLAALSRHNTSQVLWQLGDGIVTTHNVSIGDLACCVIL